MLLAAAATDAVCGNLVVNGDFTASHDGWQLSGTCQVFDDDAVGSPVRGSLGMNCLGAGAPSQIASQCVNIASGPVDFSARWTRNTSLPPADTVGIGFEAFADGQCAGASLGILAAQSTIDVPGVSCCGEPWREMALSNVALPAGTNSIAVMLATGAGDVLVFDHVFFGLSSIFADAFEGDR